MACTLWSAVPSGSPGLPCERSPGEPAPAHSRQTRDGSRRRVVRYTGRALSAQGRHPSVLLAQCLLFPVLRICPDLSREPRAAPRPACPPHAAASIRPIPVANAGSRRGGGGGRGAAVELGLQPADGRRCELLGIREAAAVISVGGKAVELGLQPADAASELLQARETGPRVRARLCTQRRPP